MIKFTILLKIALITVITSCKTRSDENINRNKNSKNNDMNNNMYLEKATFGGGCFWCVEAVFDELNGVKSAVSGYAGGEVENPTYKQVTSGTTGHAEVVQVTFDPSLVSYETLLDVFWTVHDPTQLNRQGNDIGTQYRSIILYENEQQKIKAEQSIKSFEASNMYDGSFTTQVVPLVKFYSAEEYHQGYFKSNSSEPYCSLVVLPKIEKFRKKFADKLKPEFR